MKVRMGIAMSGSRNGQPWPTRGEVVDLPDSEGADLCASGVASPVTEDEAETAVPPTDDVEERGKRRGGRPKLPRDEDGNIIREQG